MRNSYLISPFVLKNRLTSNVSLNSKHQTTNVLSAKFSRRERQHLTERFPGLWIGSSGPNKWPASYPDLTPLDYFLRC